jgi:hypothetical protein
LDVPARQATPMKGLHMLAESIPGLLKR